MAPEPRFAVADPVAEFRAMIAALHGAGIEVVLDVVLNHTRRERHLGPDAVAARPRQRQPTTGSIPPTRPLPRLDRLRQHAGPRPPARSAAGHGRAAPLGRRWASTASASISRRCSAATGRRVPRRMRPAAGDRAGPGAGPAQADRRALGYRAGRLPRAGSRRPSRVERPLPRRGAPLLARRRGDAAGARRPAAGLGRPVRGRRAPAPGERQLGHQP